MAVTKKFKTKPEVQVTFEVIMVTTKLRVPYKFMWWVSLLDWETSGTEETKMEHSKPQLNLPTNQQDSYQYRYRFVLADGSEKFDNEVQADGYCSNPLVVEPIISVTQQ